MVSGQGHQFVQSPTGCRGGTDRTRLSLSPSGANHQGPLLSTSPSSAPALTLWPLSCLWLKSILLHGVLGTHGKRGTLGVDFSRGPLLLSFLALRCKSPSPGGLYPEHSGPLSQLEGWDHLVLHLRQVL